jgi:hypothetical protein
MSDATVSAVWRRVPGDLEARLEGCLAAALANAPVPVEVFFRADDIAVPGRAFRRLLEIFAAHRFPLNLALVPAWLTDTRWRVLSRLAGGDPRRWCWHQHGWRHFNHESEGKKQEFGPARDLADIEADLTRGRRRLEMIAGADFYPVFTPPWNRCDARTLERLMVHGYRAVSRSAGSRPSAPPGLADISVNVDFHTRRERNPADGWRNLLGEVQAALKSGRCGLMIHHQRMNPAAFAFLDLFLALIGRQDTVRPVDLRDMSA